MTRRERLLIAREKATDLKSRIAEDESRSYWTRGLSWLLVAKIIIEILLLILDSQDEA